MRLESGGHFVSFFVLTHWGRVTHICWIIVNWILRNKLKWNLNRNANIFIQENSFESVVCETATILSRPQCVNIIFYNYATNRTSADNKFNIGWKHFGQYCFQIRVRSLGDMIQNISKVDVILYFFIKKYITTPSPTPPHPLRETETHMSLFDLPPRYNKHLII